MKYPELEEKMKKTINVLKENLSGIRAGRANPAVLNKLTVDYYGVQTPISQISTISVPEARTLVIQPYEPTSLKNIEKAIMQSDIGINPNNDGKVIRLSFPPLTEERRKELVKSAHKISEDDKVAIRAIRRDYIEKAKVQKKKSEITEDDLKDIEKDVQKITDDYIKEIDKIFESKKNEIMEV